MSRWVSVPTMYLLYQFQNVSKAYGPLCAFLFLTLSSSVAAGSPGPDTVAVIVNNTLVDSVELGARYAAARDIPAPRVCGVDLPDEASISLEVYRERLLIPLRRCLMATGGMAAIEALVLAKGIPLEVRIPVDGEEHTVSTAAALGLGDSTTADGGALLGNPPGRPGRCGDSVCLGAHYYNPYRDGRFSPEWTADVAGNRWHPLLVTMLNGYSYADAERLIQSALDAEHDGPSGQFVLMDGGDSARSTLDWQLDDIGDALRTRGVEVLRPSFDPELSGLEVGAFVTGTVRLGQAIEGNRYRPGALVDNLTSFGAVSRNFAPDQEVQTSIARWVAMGVAGVHGTTSEPLSNCFPSRQFLVDYVDGWTLAEAFHRNLPFAYWRNLVLGDPMAAPYARRPTVDVMGAQADQENPSTVQLSVAVEDQAERPLDGFKVFVDGRLVHESNEPAGRLCLDLAPSTDSQVLVTARLLDDPGTVGWRAVNVRTESSGSSCTPEDAGIVDATSDQGVSDAQFDRGVSLDGGIPDLGEIVLDASTPPDGDGCASLNSGQSSLLLLLFLVAIGMLRSRFRMR